ncbi:MAG: hypothetical protein B6U75_00170 [Desulfurococcales archaeon ex4484_217_1]|nr:MAG: hypothetical protein B6U75_00170 [Desulfurococcales archaeon ex4484_217_1]
MGERVSIDSIISDLTTRVITAAWALFMLSWAIGWLLKGSPIPIYRVKRFGQDMVEDAIMGAFWLAIGTSIFALIKYLASAF